MCVQTNLLRVIRYCSKWIEKTEKNWRCSTQKRRTLSSNCRKVCKKRQCSSMIKFVKVSDCAKIGNLSKGKNYHSKCVTRNLLFFRDSSVYSDRVRPGILPHACLNKLSKCWNQLMFTTEEEFKQKWSFLNARTDHFKFTAQWRFRRGWFRNVSLMWYRAWWTPKITEVTAAG